jgi:peptidase M28-like protein
MVAALALAAAFGVPAPTAQEVRAVDEALVACGTRHSLSSWTDPKRGIGCGRDVVVKRFEGTAAKDPKAKLVVDKFEASGPRTRDVAVPMENVYLVLEGEDPERKKTAIVISGHYDSMCTDNMDSTCDAPGADDDASGTTIVIESARLLAGRPRKATIVLAALAGEEQGLFGGKRLKTWLETSGYTVGAVLNNDIIGATNGAADPRPRVFSAEDATIASRSLGLWLEEQLGAEAVRLVFRNDRFGRGGDHMPFLEAGLPAVRFTEPKEDYRHQHQTPRVENGVEYGDLTKFMDFEFLASATRLNAEAADRLARAPAPPTEVTVEGAVKPDATVTFQAPADALRKGFEILSRDTTEVRWSVVKTVDAAGAIVVPGLTIDDRAFAVRAVGKDGLTSIPVFAKPIVRRPPGYVPSTTPTPAPTAKP